MATAKITDTKKAKNLVVDFSGSPTLDEMELRLSEAGLALGLVMSHITTLSKLKYPGNRHWHFKQSLDAKGCLDVTYWPGGELLWITMRNSEPPWVHEAGQDLAASLLAAR